MSEKFVQQVIDATDPAMDKVALNIGTAEGRYINPLLVKYGEVYAFEADGFSPGKVPAIKLAYESALKQQTTIADLKRAYETAIVSSGGVLSLRDAYETALKSLNRGEVVSLFDFNRVHVIDKAVGPESGTIKLYMSSTNVGRHTINEDHWEKQKTDAAWGYSNHFNLCECVTIDETCKSLKVGMILCDIEGGEALIFAGGRKTLRDNDIDVIVELHDEVDFRPMINIFKEFEYNIYTETGRSCDGMTHALFSNREQWKNELPTFMDPIIL